MEKSSTKQPLFESKAIATLQRATSTFGQRGQEYGDTWHECRFLKLRAVAKALGYEINPEHLRALATAAFSDMKYWRLLGGYKDDSIVDGINYDAFLAEEMRTLTFPKTNQPRRCDCKAPWPPVVSSPVDTVETCQSCGGIIQ